MEIINTMLQWPVIIQGALGSFLFWISFEVIKKSVNYINRFFEKFNKDLKKERLTYEFLQREFNISSGTKISNIMLCLYAASHHIIKGIIFIILGLVLSNIIPFFEDIGYFIALFYFFRALNAVKMDIEQKMTIDDQKIRIEKISKELNESNI